MKELYPGMEYKEFTQIMGEADKVKCIKSGTKTQMVYLYINQPIGLYRQLESRNYTPFIFENEILSSWGWDNLENADYTEQKIIKER
jgi:hypothetical protein